MKIAEFHKEHRNCQKRMALRMTLSFGTLFFALLLGFVSGVFFGPVAQAVVGPICVAVGFPLLLFGFHLSDRTYRDFSSLTCPHCDGSLFKSKSVIVATGNCPTCGRRVLKDGQIGT